MRDIDVYGIGNALVDLLVDITEEEFQALGFERGSMRLTEPAEQAALLTKFARKSAKVSGGSLGNSIVALAQLGGKGALTCAVSNDENGSFYRHECESLGILLPSDVVPGGATGTCLSLITPDAERTMRTALGVSAAIDAKHVSRTTMERSTYVFIEGYLFANPEGGTRAIHQVLEEARACGTKVAITCSEPWVVSSFRDSLENAVKEADLVFCNEEEALALSGAKTIQDAGASLSKRIPHLVITGGPQGAFIWWNGESLHAPAVSCQPRDLTGAGDMFAGAFLYGITHGFTPVESAKRANALASLVIRQVGTRLTVEIARRTWG